MDALINNRWSTSQIFKKVFEVWKIDNKPTDKTNKCNYYYFYYLLFFQPFLFMCVLYIKFYYFFITYFIHLFIHFRQFLNIPWFINLLSSPFIVLHFIYYSIFMLCMFVCFQLTSKRPIHLGQIFFWQPYDPKKELLMAKDEKFCPEKCRHSLFLKMREF